MAEEEEGKEVAGVVVAADAVVVDDVVAVAVAFADVDVVCDDESESIHTYTYIDEKTDSRR